jgi:siderophore ferric iron reductase
MARSFLFAQTDADAATTRLIALAAEKTGFMKGQPGMAPEGWHLAGRDNGPLLAALRAELAATYPSAGAALRAVRLYTNLIWQPAYLMVIGTHLHGAIPDLGGLGQQRRGIYVDGYRLASATLWSGTTEAMIARGAAQLAGFAEGVLGEVNAQEKLRPLPARRLLADRMLSLMVWLAARRPDLPPAVIRDYCEQWLEAMDLSGQGALQSVFAPDGREMLIVQRKGCCLDYRIDPTRLCASCPKQDDAVRVGRQSANALAELG